MIIKHCIHVSKYHTYPPKYVQRISETHMLFINIFLLKDFTMDCGICYAYQLDGAIPDQVCDNSQCGQPFHQICLYEVKNKNIVKTFFS